MAGNGDGGLGKEFVAKMKKGHERRNRLLSKIFDKRDFGSLQSFVNAVMTDKKARWRCYRMGDIHPSVKKDMAASGIKLESEEVLISDKSILKYLDHPKSAKNAAIKMKDFYKLQRVFEHPTSIYQDTDSGSVVYVYARGLAKNDKKERQVMKIVIHPNFTKNGKTYNLIKSAGLVPLESMNTTDENGNRVYRILK